MPTEKRQRQKEGQRARREAALAAAKRRQRKRQLITFVVITVLVFGGIFLLTRGGGSKKQNASTAGSSTTSTTAPGSTTTTAKPNTDLSTPVTVPVDKGQTISVDRGPAPTTLVSKDLTVGTGAEAKLGDTIEVNYAGVSYADGTVFDSSFTRGQTASFPLKDGGLIEGWVKGIPGMKVGGRRELIIPSAMAYGDQPQGGQPAGALIFIVDLVSIK